MRGRNLNLLAFVIVCGSIAYFDMKKCHRLPWPPRFIFAGLTFFLLEIISLMDETISGVSAIGFVIAILVQKGFVANCPDSQAATGSPAQVEFVGDYTGPDQGIASLTEYQTGQQPGGTGATLA